MPALILLPPSKTMSLDADGPPWTPEGPLRDARQTVAEAYQRTARSNRARFGTAVDASGELLEDARELAADLFTMPTGPAGLRYTGQLHAHAGYAGLSGTERRRYSEHVRVVSGLLGLVAPDEAVPAYRLPMGAQLPRVGPLATFWRAPLSAEVARQADGEPIWDLLSAEYQRALAVPAEQHVVVRLERADGRAAPAVIGKQVKGALARYLALHDADPAALGGFEIQGFRLAEVRPGPPRLAVLRAEN